MKLPSGTYIKDYRDEGAIVHTRLQYILLFAAIVILALLPLFAGKTWLHFCITTCISMLAVFGLYIVTALCGQISLGQAALMGVGSYTYGILITRCDLPIPVSMICAGIIPFLFGLLLGFAALRAKGFYLAMVTLGAQFVLYWCFIHFHDLTGGNTGLVVPRPRVGGEVLSPATYYYIVVVLTVVLGLAAKNIRRTKWGRAFLAIRDDDLAAEAIGINLFQGKLLAFGIACFYAGIAGAFSTFYYGLVAPDQFTLWESVLYLAMIVIGGMGSLIGAIFGTLFVKLILRLIWLGAMGETTVILSPLIFGGIIVIFLIFEPRGLSHLWDRFKSFYRFWPYSY